jgi:ABC-type polysaccharide/polyol phosphate export permease
MLLGMVCARFRDLQPLIGSILQVALFVTPIFFSPDQLGSSLAVMLNPLFHMTDIVRASLLGKYAMLESWGFCIGMLIAGWLITIYLFARFRRRVAFWL